MAGPTTVTTPFRTAGRSARLRAVDALSDGVHAGRGGALVLAAAPGLGRTALLAHAARAFRSRHPSGAGTVLSTRAVPAESLIPYSGLHSLWCAGADFPAPPESPGALLAMVRNLAGRGPLLLCVDDVHLWDAASRAALGFTARRLVGPHPAGLLVSVTERRADDPHLAELPVLRLDPLAPDEAGALFDELTRGEAAPAVRDEVLRAAGGNPGLLHGIVAGLTPPQLSGRAALPRPLPARPAPSCGGLAPETGQVLLLAAAAHVPGAESAGADADLVLRAAGAAGLDGAALVPAEAAGVVHLADGRVRFDTPGLRERLYADAPPARRRAAHRLLAAALDDTRTPPLLRRLHRALAAAGPDPALAAALVAAADDTGTGVGHAERAAALAAAADLTEAARERALRRTAAADHARLAGRPARARELLATARAESTDPLVRGAVELTRGRLALGDGPVADAREALLLAAELLLPHDPDAAAEARFCAMAAAWDMGDARAYLSALGTPLTATAPVAAPPAAPSAMAAPPAPAAPAAPPPAAISARRDRTAADPQAEEYRAAMLVVMRGRLSAASRRLRNVVDQGERADDPGRLLRAGVAALVAGDLAAASRVNARALAAARATGTDIHVPQALEHLAYAELRAGRHARARAHAEEGLRAAAATGQCNIAAQHHAILALVASVEGDGEAVTARAAAAARIADRHGLAQAATLAQWALARHELSRGRAPEAAARLGPVVRPGPRRGHFAVRMLAVPCYVEAAVLAGEGERARSCVAEFAEWAAQGADPQAPAQLARCHALLAGPEESDALYAVALARHELSGGDFEHARTQLLHGKWLRRRRRPGEARGRLRDALISFERCGARAWAEQARAELRATGEAGAAEPPEGPLSSLTPQQLRIARRVAEGATNREVARHLSVSPRTVDHHLRNVFALLGVRSRVELSRLVARCEQLSPHDGR
ncbi:helix-turn-helix transcriptional regulator [Streptomyces alfalfae]|uniref:helix-turn-helix transcriptional regulator n=1 Tax=Streptomyces alfalfae TaxID=1642299 RepID=UPI001FD21B6E|nr:LuxR family transcriptional regulator [Streptomyces alfalfae]